MLEVWFLICLGAIAIIIAMFQDLKSREVANWISLLLIAFALGFRFFWSLFEANNFLFFYQGLMGLGIFFVLGTGFYYGRVFAGGDAKLMIALGTVLPLSNIFSENVGYYFSFIFLFLISGAIYGIFSSLLFAFKNKKNFNKEFRKQFVKNRKLIYFVSIFGILILTLSFVNSFYLFFGIIVFLSPYFYLWAKSVDEACMVKEVSPEKLTEGDWLYKDFRIGNKLIKAKWDGLSKKEISLLRKNKKKVLIRYGIPFMPVFLIAFILFIYFWFL